MVVVGGDPGRLELSGGGRDDDQAVGLLVDRGAELAELGRQGGDAVGLLVADVGDVADPRDPVGEQGDDRQGHHGVADRVHVHVDGPQRSARARSFARARASTVQPMCSRMSTNAMSPWRLVGAEPLDGDRAARDRGEGEEVAGGRGVGLDRVVAAA